MRKITKEEFYDKYPNYRQRNSKAEKFLEALRALEVLQGVFISDEEWPLQTGCASFVLQSFRKGRSDKRFKTHKINTGDMQGTMILRTK